MLPIIYFGTLLILLLGLPPFGLLLAGYSLSPHLTLFPIPTDAGPLSISWLVFGTLGTFILASLVAPIWRFFNFPASKNHESLHAADFPTWGWIAILWVTSSWLLAWTRFSWFQAFQPHTFPLLWLGYIVTLNALTYQRSGHCLLLDRPRSLAQLLFLSAGFWWTFEYLNQYVNNWHYLNVPTTSLFEYILYTSISFSTVLPAVLSTYVWLNTFPRLTEPFKNWRSLSWVNYQKTGWLFLSLGIIGLLAIGIWPTVLFPLLWLCPLFLLLGIQCIRKEQTYFQNLAQGDWCPIVLSALASLLCGFWWELWNVYSLVHWEYSLPYVHAFKLFEMPILGYSGYLPFGMVCLAVTEAALRYQTNRPQTTAQQRRRHNEQ